MKVDKMGETELKLINICGATCISDVVFFKIEDANMRS